MRVRAVLLPLLLLLSPGHGMSPGVHRAVAPEAWSALGWSFVPSRRDPSLFRHLVPAGALQAIGVDSAGADRRPVCPMPVVPVVRAPALPLSDRPRPQDSRVAPDSVSGHRPFHIPVVPSGCWNPLFLRSPDSPRLQTAPR